MDLGTLGLRGILLFVAIILFVIAVFSDTNWTNLIAWGLAAFAASFLAGDVTVGSLGARRR
jgi:peptidoglycan/LPS O-acetylase OafA/YrhL